MKLGFVLPLLFLCSCTTLPRQAPRFTIPSTSHIQKSTQETKIEVTQAQTKTKEIEKTVAQEPAGPVTDALNIQIHDLELNLTNALTSLDTTEKARVDLDKTLQAETQTANNLAKDYDTAQQQLSQQKTIINQVNSKWGLGAFAYGFKVLFKHLLILAVVVAVLAVGIAVLSMFFPVIGVALGVVGSFFQSLFSRFKK